MTLHVVVDVRVPALDGLVAYLSAADQVRIDALKEKLSRLTERLRSSAADLQTSLSERSRKSENKGDTAC